MNFIKAILKESIQIIFSLIFLIFGIGYIWSLWLFGNNVQLDYLLENHVLATIGVPLAIMASATIVAIFELQSGSIKFQIFDVKYEGAAGQIIMWVICFFAIVSGLKILW
ncbi:MAG: hypothetical protein WBM32_18030 [Crocosphaera sp.]